MYEPNLARHVSEYQPPSEVEQFVQASKPLITTKQLAEILSRSVEGLRFSLQQDTEFARSLNATKVKLGRRVYFKTAQVAKVIGLS